LPQQQAPYQPTHPTAVPQGYPGNTPNTPASRKPQALPQGYPPVPARLADSPQQNLPKASSNRRNATSASPARMPFPMPQFEAPPEPEAPGLFPPHTMEQFNQLLLPGAQQYTVVESSLGDGKRKIVRIAYAACAGWQQAATLLKALREHQEEQLNTIIIQGVLSQQSDVYAFTNGQLQFDRNVYLGSSIGSRYVVETGNGFAVDTIRFVLNE
jgi:hypothetical protein